MHGETVENEKNRLVNFRWMEIRCFVSYDNTILYLWMKVRFKQLHYLKLRIKLYEHSYKYI
jgi:hypothetical protein